MSNELFQALSQSAVDVVSVFRAPVIADSPACKSVGAPMTGCCSFKYLSPSAYELLLLHCKGDNDNALSAAHTMSVFDFPPAPSRGAYFARIDSRNRPVFFRNTFWQKERRNKEEAEGGEKVTTGNNDSFFVAVSVDENISYADLDLDNYHTALALVDVESMTFVGWQGASRSVFGLHNVTVNEEGTSSPKVIRESVDSNVDSNGGNGEDSVPLHLSALVKQPLDFESTVAAIEQARLSSRISINYVSSLDKFCRVKQEQSPPLSSLNEHENEHLKEVHRSCGDNQHNHQLQDHLRSPTTVPVPVVHLHEHPAASGTGTGTGTTLEFWPILGRRVDSHVVAILRKNPNNKSDMIGIAQNKDEKESISSPTNVVTTAAAAAAAAESSKDKDSMTTTEMGAATAAATTASNMKSKFLATMSHEIRTPINGVIGATSLLDMTDLSDEQREYVDIIATSADMLLSLVNNIMDISKIEKGCLQFDRVEVKLSQLVMDCCLIMKTRSRERSVKLKPMFFESLEQYGGWYFCDPTRVKQVVLNFLSNAVKFSHEGGCVEVRVGIGKESIENEEENKIARDSDWSDADTTTSSSVRVSFAEQESYTAENTGAAAPSAVPLPSAALQKGEVKDVPIFDTIYIEVKDYGIGVEDSSKLFSDFVQASPHTATTYGGTGLGLSITKRIVELMGGSVGLQSVYGEGTTVWAKFKLNRVTNVPKMAPYGVRSTSSGLLSTMYSPTVSPQLGYRSLPNTHPNQNAIICAPLGSSSSSCPPSSDSELNNHFQARILVVEDNSVNQKVIVRMLHSLQYRNVSVANNGQMAVNMVQSLWDAKSQLFDIIFMDCQMPVMDGWAATYAIRNLEKMWQVERETGAVSCSNNSNSSSNSPHNTHAISLALPTTTTTAPTSDLQRNAALILALTANATVEDRAMCLQTGMDEFYVKPITRERVVAIMMNWAAGQQSAAKAEA